MNSEPTEHKPNSLAYTGFNSTRNNTHTKTFIAPTSHRQRTPNYFKFNLIQKTSNTMITMFALLGILAMQSPAVANAAQNCDSLNLNNYDNVGDLEQDINQTSCSELRVTGTFTWTKWNNFVRITKDNLTISGFQTAQVQGAQFIVQASDVTVQGIRFNPNNNNVSGVIVGCPADFSSNCEANLNVKNSIIRRNLFTGYKNTVPVVVAASSGAKHTNTQIIENAFGGFKGAGELNKAIQIGSAFDNDWKGIAADPQNNFSANAHPSPIPRDANGADIQDNLSDGLKGEWMIPWGTIVRNNIISTPIKLGRQGGDGVAAKQAVAIQLYFPTTVENNCIASDGYSPGFFNGISAKGSWNNIVGNTVANTWGDGALYMRDGDLNVWAHNQVTSNNNGFWTMSGRSNIFVRNFFNNNNAYGKVLGGKEENKDVNGKLLRTGHLVNFANGPASTLGETSYHFPSTNTLFTQNHFWYTRNKASQRAEYWNAAIASRDLVVSRNRAKQNNTSPWQTSSLFAPIAPNANGTLNVNTRWNSTNSQAYKDVFERMTLRPIFINYINDEKLKPTKAWFGNFAVWPNWSNSGFQRAKTNGFGYYESFGVFNVPPQCEWAFENS